MVEYTSEIAEQVLFVSGKWMLNISQSLAGSSNAASLGCSSALGILLDASASLFFLFIVISLN
jgi:hypothetical protein